MMSVRRQVCRANSTANSRATWFALLPCEAAAKAFAAPPRRFCEPFCRVANNS